MLIIHPYKNNGLFPKTIYFMVFGPPVSSGCVLSSLLVELESQSKWKRLPKFHPNRIIILANTPPEIQRNLEAGKMMGFQFSRGFVLFQGSICWKKNARLPQPKPPGLGWKTCTARWSWTPTFHRNGLPLRTVQGAWRGVQMEVGLEGHLLYKKNPEVC